MHKLFRSKQKRATRTCAEERSGKSLSSTVRNKIIVMSNQREKVEDVEEKKKLDEEHFSSASREQGIEGGLQMHNQSDDKKGGRRVFRLLRRTNSEVSSSSSSSTVSTSSNKSKEQRKLGTCIVSSEHSSVPRSSENEYQTCSSPSASTASVSSPTSGSSREKITRILKKPFQFQRRSTKSVKSNETNATICDVNIVPAMDDEDSKNLEIIHQKFPETTLMERKRFLAHRTLERAIEKLEYYTTWRREYHLDSPEFQKRPAFKSDGDVWDWVVEYAAKHYNGKKEQEMATSLPRIVRFGDGTDLKAVDGRRIVQVLPGMVDKSIAPQEFYALCVAFYLDVKLSRDSNEDIHVLVDVRAGRNWPNAPATVLVPFVKQLTKQLADNFPERMYHSIVYPIPSLAKPIWAMFKTFLHPKILTKIDILWGPAWVNSPTPRGILDGTLNEEALEAIEAYRISEFL